MNRAEKRKFHYIYKTTCLITNRYYIGMHSTDNMNDGYMGSGKRLWRSFNKHGRDNHKVEILEFLDSRIELKQREKDLVTKELIGEDLCMNLKEGGEGGFCSEEHMKKAQIAGRKSRDLKIKENEEYKKIFIAIGVKNWKNYHLTGKHKYDTFTGKQHSDETKTLMSDKAKERIGDKNSQYGTCWITKDGENKKIKREDFDSYVSDGWIKGRK